MSGWHGTRSRGRWALEFTGLVLLAVIGPAITWGAARDTSAHGVVFGLVGTALALMGCVVLPLELRLILRRPGARLGATPDGEPATVIPRVAWHIPHLRVAMGIIVAWPTASAVIALTDGQIALAIVLAAIALFPASYLPALFSGRVKAGGLYLTPTGVLHINHGRWWHAPWDDVLGALDREELLAVLLHEGRAPKRGQWTAHFGWRGEPKPSRPGSLVVNTRFLRLDPRLAAVLIIKGATEPGCRRYFGTPESLAWLIPDHERPPAGSIGREP